MRDQKREKTGKVQKLLKKFYVHTGSALTPFFALKKTEKARPNAQVRPIVEGDIN